MRSRQQGALVDLMAWVVGSIGRRQSCSVRILREILLSVGGRNEWRRGKNDENYGWFLSSWFEGWAWGWCSAFPNVACWIAC